MAWIIVTGAALFLIYFIQTRRRGIHIFNVANSIILAAITYEKLSPERRKAADEMLNRLLTKNDKSGETFDALWQPDREIARWRWYSLAFAYEKVAPEYVGAVGWAYCKRNVFHDVIDMHKGIPSFTEHLERREPYQRYLRFLR
ncbi:hypothetical protein [Dongia mobilis]|uniref:hypothetical protein n=1 Tax=Dongia sp. TaxID=1977262 RepID=UPI0026EF4C85